MLMKLKATELSSGKLNDESLKIAVEQVKKNGYIGFEKVLSDVQIKELNNAFLPLFDEYSNRKGFNTGKNRAQMHLPFTAPFVSAHVVANGIAMSVIDQILGEDNRCAYLASDTACPGSEYQNVHSDASPLFPELGVSLPTYSLVMNIPLVDVNEDNGPLEVWPGGTHLDPDNTKHIDIEGDMVRAAKTMHSETIHMPAGSIVIRDIRMWHRGTPNRSSENRTNIALIYNNSWYGGGGTIQIPEDDYQKLPDRVQKLFRFEKIGYPVKMPWEWE